MGENVKVSTTATHTGTTRVAQVSGQPNVVYGPTPNLGGLRYTVNARPPESRDNS